MAGFQSLPALAIRQPDLGRILGRVADLKTSRLQNQLLQQKMDRETELAAVRRKIFAGDPSGGQASGAQVTNALAAGGGPTPQAAAILERGTGGAGMRLPDVNSPAMREFMTKFPAEAGPMISNIFKMEDRQAEQKKQQTATVARVVMGIQDLPEERRAEAYDQGLAQIKQAGIPTPNAPPRYDPRTFAQWANGIIKQAMTVHEIFAERERQRKPPTLQTYFGPQGRERRGYMQGGKMVQVGGAKARAPTALEGKIDEMMSSLDVDRATATSIATGAVTVVPDQTYGGVHIVDKTKGTSKYIPAGGGAQGGVPPTAAKPTIPTDVSYPEGTGGSGFIGWGINTIADAVGMKLPYEEADRAVQGLNNIQIRTLTLLQAAIPGRPSKYLLEKLELLTVKPASLLMGDSRAGNRLMQTRDMIREEIERIDRDILSQAGTFSRKDIAAARMNKSQLESLLRDYDVVVTSFEEVTSRDGTLSPEDDALVKKYLK